MVRFARRGEVTLADELGISVEDTLVSALEALDRMYPGEGSGMAQIIKGEAIPVAVPFEELVDCLDAWGYHISLDGPNRRMVTPEYRWTLRVFSHAEDQYGSAMHRSMYHAASPNQVLSVAIAALKGPFSRDDGGGA